MKIIKSFAIITIAFLSFALFAIIDDSNYDNIMFEKVFPAFGFTNPSIRGYKYRPKYFTGTDNIKIAYDIFGPKDAQFAIALFPGKGESFVKYAEFMYDLEQLSGNNIRFFVMDHRGSGFSGRFNTEAKGCSHVDSFDSCVRDLKIFMDTIVRNDQNWDYQNKPVFLFAHSMGGGISARFLEKHHGYFSKAILCSPMIQPRTIISEKFPEWLNFNIAFAVASTMCLLYPTEYAMGQATQTDGIVKFEGNDVSHSKNRFYNWKKNLLGDKANPGLFHEVMTAGVTWNWLKQACVFSKDIQNRAKQKNEVSNIPILLLQAGLDDVVSINKEDYFSRYSPNCKIVKFPKAFHEIYNETDGIRGDGVHLSKNYATSPGTVLEYVLSFSKISLLLK